MSQVCRPRGFIVTKRSCFLPAANDVSGGCPRRQCSDEPYCKDRPPTRSTEKSATNTNCALVVSADDGSKTCVKCNELFSIVGKDGIIVTVEKLQNKRCRVTIDGGNIPPPPQL